MLMCYIWINDIPPTPDAVGVHYPALEQSPASNMRIEGYADGRSGNSHHYPKSRWDPRDNRLFHRYYPGQFGRSSMPQHNIVEVLIPDCRDLMIGSQQTNRKPNQITCRITEKFQLQSRITNESQFQFRDPRSTSTEPQWQTTSI
jgi:hypothetical protein